MLDWNDAADEQGAAAEGKEPEPALSPRERASFEPDHGELDDEDAVDPPAALKSIPLADIDERDTTFQFRFNTDPRSLLDSMKRDGQIDPIKIMPGKKTYTVLDGFRRTACARKLGRKEILALVYPILPATMARRIAIVSNVKQETLAAHEKANAMQAMRDDGRSVSNIAKFFGMSAQQVRRYLSIPKKILPSVGTKLTITHAMVIGELGQQLSESELQQLVSRIIAERMTVRELRELLKAEGMSEKRGRTRSFGTVQKKLVRIYDVTLMPNSPPDEVEALSRFLREALARLDEFRRGDTRSEK